MKMRSRVSHSHVSELYSSLEQEGAGVRPWENTSCPAGEGTSPDSHSGDPSSLNSMRYSGSSCQGRVVDVAGSFSLFFSFFLFFCECIRMVRMMAGGPVPMMHFTVVEEVAHEVCCQKGLTFLTEQCKGTHYASLPTWTHGPFEALQITHN